MEWKCQTTLGLQQSVAMIHCYGWHDEGRACIISVRMTIGRFEVSTCFDGPARARMDKWSRDGWPARSFSVCSSEITIVLKTFKTINSGEQTLVLLLSRPSRISLALYDRIVSDGDILYKSYQYIRPRACAPKPLPTPPPPPLPALNFVAVEVGTASTVCIRRVSNCSQSTGRSYFARNSIKSGYTTFVRPAWTFYASHGHP